MFVYFYFDLLSHNYPNGLNEYNSLSYNLFSVSVTGKVNKSVDGRLRRDDPKFSFAYFMFVELKTDQLSITKKRKK